MGYVPTGGSGGASIGGTVTGATAGSVFFAGAAGVMAQDNAGFFYDDANNQLKLTASAATQTPIQINLAAAHSANAFEVKNSGGTTIASISKDGYVTATATGSLSTANFKIAGSESGLNVAGTNSAFIMDSGSAYVGFFNYGTAGVYLNPAGQFAFTGTSIAAGNVDAGLARSAAGIVKITNGSTGAGALHLQEQTAPSAPATNNVYIYAEDNGSGKTRLMALFPTGAAQQVAIEP